MNESLIRDTTPTSSPILAYGESAPSSIGRFGVVAIGIFVAILIACGVCIALAQKIPIPASPSLIAGITSGTRLPASSPEIWRTAQERSRPFPVFVGFAPVNGEQQPFVIAPRFALPAGIPQTAIWGLQGERVVADATTTRISAVASSFFSWPWLRVWPTRLLPIISTDEGIDELPSIFGPLTEDSWKTNVPFSVNDDREPTDFAYENSIDLSSAPSAWPFIQTMLQRDGHPVSELPTPDLVSWSRSDTGDVFTSITYFHAPPETIRRGAAVAEPRSQQTYTLPDGTITDEFVSTSTHSASDDFNQSPLTINFGNVTTTRQWTPSRTCQGHVFAHLTLPSFVREAVDPTLAESFSKTHLLWSSDTGKLRICWE